MKHSWLMLACLAVPIALLVIVYGFGVRNQAVFWIALAMCPLMHIVMMKMHKGEKCH